MVFDVCLVTYHSEKWMEGCIAALARAADCPHQIHIYIADSACDPASVLKIEKILAQHKDAFGKTSVFALEENRGFGAGCNAAAKEGSGEYVFFCNPDTEIAPDAFVRLAEAIDESDPSFAAFEMRQAPYEHPKYYDPVTQETDWASGACVAVRREVFTRLGGFDENIFMYGEDVELSLRLRLYGWRIRYVPRAVIYHYAYEVPGQGKPLQEAGSLLGNYYLRCKYGTQEEIFRWETLRLEVQNRLADDAAYKQVPQMVEEKLPALRALGKTQRAFYKNEVAPRNFKVAWQGLEYTFARGGAFFAWRSPKPTLRFSVLLRAYRRPELLEQALQSLMHQTYKNFEVIVVEDGAEPVCGAVAEWAKQRLDLTYLPLARAAGRSAAGNVALGAAQGERLVFLDDDDFFFAEHLELLAQMAEEHPECGMVAMGSVEARRAAPEAGGVTVSRRNRMEREFSLVHQCLDNYFPIQTVAFCRTLFEQYGGFDETLDALEDWDLWTRYACHTRVALGEKCTSVYHISADDGELLARGDRIAQWQSKLREKWSSYPLGERSAAEILALSQAPEQSSERYRQYTHRLAVQAVVRQLTGCRRWRCTAPLRAIPCLLNRLAGGKNARFARWQLKVGPQAPDIEKATTAQLESYEFSLRSSLCWRLTGGYQ